MRMWLVPPKLMCRKHLLGEHVELHMLVGCIRKGIKLDGYVKTGLVELDKIKKRHNELVAEMTRRGYKHKSALPKFTCTIAGKVSIAGNKKELARRCKECRKRMN